MDFANYWFSSGAGGGGGYQIGESLRFRYGVAQNLSRSVSGSPTSATAATLSFWHKRGRSAGGYNLFDVRASGTDYGFTAFIPYNPGFAWGDATFGSAENATGVTNYWTLNQYPSQPALRDFSAWYHIVVQWDSNNGTSTRRQRIWVNGVEYDFYNYYGSIGSGRSCPWTRSGYTFKWGYSNGMDGYLAEVHLIDGQVLNPTNFAEENADGVWVPKEVSGLSYGNSGYYLDFSDPNSIGADRSGNGNNFTPTGFELTNTSSTSYDWMADSPTDNYSTANPLGRGPSVFKDGNLLTDARSSGNPDGGMPTSTVRCGPSGKYYAEMTVEGLGEFCISAGFLEPGTGNVRSKAAYYRAGDITVDQSGSVGSGASYSGGATVGIGLDMDNLQVRFVGPAGQNYGPFSISGINVPIEHASLQFHQGSSSGACSGWLNYGNRPFAHTPPSGFEPLSTANLPDAAITNPSEHFGAIAYTGDGTNNRVITGLNFQPDFTWVKNRSSANSHVLQDSVRGITANNGNQLCSNNTFEENNNGNGHIGSYNSNGFTLVDGTSGPYPRQGTNDSGDNYVAWCWKAGGTAVTNNDGSIQTQVSANTTAGFSVITYSGNSTNNSTIGHGLNGKVPAMIITKVRTGATNEGWPVWHQKNGNTQYLLLNNNGGLNTDSNVYGGSNNTTPTGSVYSVGAGGVTNTSGRTYVAYCWAEVPGFSSFGKYSGNSSSNGAFVYLGFRPAYLIIVGTNSGSWQIYDSARMQFNPGGSSNSALQLEANNGSNPSGSMELDLLSNGFKCRTADSAINLSGREYVYMAFAEHPLGGANVSPSPAR